MPLLESDIENKVGDIIVKWAKGQTVPFTLMYLKLNILGWRGFPDRMLLAHGPKILFIEYKRPGENLRANQRHIRDILLEMGFNVEVHDNVDTAVESIKAYFQPSPTPATSDGEDADPYWDKAVHEAWKRENVSRTKDLPDTEE